MYLKQLEIIGFKSFAERTVLAFEPGLTAIVGPNGCGKSNVSDAIRWVLGEQSAKALRGSKMEDVIFNGTDSQKALGMAEVSLTLADCDTVLNMAYHEVTITRRVFRSGEGQYFINKAPCRLKDIQRLFMDTGIGTNAYSVMEQGRIDKVLSSHPEDRRAVFEEASGITKYKADKKEAIRKLEQTDANLLRLDDIIREVKRQIISLQRQAGKARRYQTLHEQLRSFDLFLTRDRLTVLDQEISTLDARIASILEQDEALRHDIEQSEQQATQARAELETIENEMTEGREAAFQARTNLERIQELIRHNQDRIGELQALSERDTKDAEESKARRDQHEAALATQTKDLEKLRAQRAEAETAMEDGATRLNACATNVDEASKLLHRLRAEQVELDARSANLQNELSDLDAEERTNIVRRERLAAEQSELQRTASVFQSRQTDMSERLKGLQASVDTCERQLELLVGQQTDKSHAMTSLQKTMGELQSRLAARRAQIEMLQESHAQREGYPEAARHILDPANRLPVDRSVVLGPLAEMIRPEPAYQMALEAALRPWLDAIVLKNDVSAIALLKDLEHSSRGAARFLVLDANISTHTSSAIPGDRLMDHVKCDAALHTLLKRMLAHVIVVRTIDDIPTPRPCDATYVTLSGALVHSSGQVEFWSRDNNQAHPLARQQLLNDWIAEASGLEEKIRAHEASIAALHNEESSVVGAVEAARNALDLRRREWAIAEGENQVISQEAKQACERVETVSWEMKSLNEQHHTGDDRRASLLQELDRIRNRQGEIRGTIGDKTEELRDLEQKRSVLQGEANERRMLFSEFRQQEENMSMRNEQLAARISELDSVIEERSRGVNTYRTRIEELKKSSEEARQRQAPLESEVQEHQQRLEGARARREAKTAAMATVETALREKRTSIDQVRTRKSQCDVELAEQRMRRQNLIDRVTGEYRIAQDRIGTEPEPTWENGQRPDRDALETMIAEIRTRLEAMGPVNLVAIEEHRELEERFTFLTTQQTDLTNAKQQLMDLIRQINKTTTEMFSKTFEQVNLNFQEMFAKLFGGGSAKLVLVDEADILESGIEIIARPPGKKLQTVSLLSGGERTMTAVALLFALFMVKPSPFCVLDELDAALDDSNIGRFVQTVQGFLDRSQFVVITHNRQTISAANVLYGVTMEQHGISKIVSVKFHDTPRSPEEPSSATEPAPASV